MDLLLSSMAKEFLLKCNTHRNWADPYLINSKRRESEKHKRAEQLHEVLNKELPMHNQGIPHASSAIRVSLRMLHTLCLHALPSARRGWSCTRRPRPPYAPKSRIHKLTRKISWRWWMARAGLMTSMYKNSAYTFWASSGQPERPSFSQIYLKPGPVNTRTTLPTWRQKRRRKTNNDVTSLIMTNWCGH